MATVSNDDDSRIENDPQAPRRDRRAAHPGHPSDAEVAAEASIIYPDTFDTPPSPDEIAAEAYAIYLARGGEHGHDREDWLEAERRVAERRRQRR